MEIKVLGPGCKRCETLYIHALEAIGEQPIKVEKVEDVLTIAGFGVMSTPALVIDEKVKSVGKVLSVAEIKALIDKQ